MSKTINQQRRSVMKAASATSLALAGGVPALASAATAVDPWERAADIVKRLSKPPVFRKQDFDVTKYGAATCKLVKVEAWKSFEEQDEMNTRHPARKTATPPSPPPSPRAAKPAAAAWSFRPATGTAPAPSCCCPT